MNLKTVSTFDLCDSQATHQVIKELCFRWRTQLNGIIDGAPADQDFDRLSVTLKDLAIRHGIQDYNAIDDLFGYFDRTELNRSTGKRGPSLKSKLDEWMLNSDGHSGSHSGNEASLNEKELRGRAEAAVDQLETLACKNIKADANEGFPVEEAGSQILKINSPAQELAKEKNMPADPERQKAVLAELDKALDDFVRDSAKDIVTQLTAFIKWNETISDVQREKLQGLILLVADLPNKQLDYTDSKQIFEPLVHSLSMLEDCQRELINVYREAGYRVPAKEQIANAVGSRLYDYLPSRWTKTMARVKLGIGPIVNGTKQAYPPHGGVIDMSAYNNQLNSIVESILAAEVDSKALMLLAKSRRTSPQHEGKAVSGTENKRGRITGSRKKRVIRNISTRKQNVVKDNRKNHNKPKAVARKPNSRHSAGNHILICFDLMGSTKLAIAEGGETVSHLMKHLKKKLISLGVDSKNYNKVGDMTTVTCTEAIANKFLRYLKKGFKLSGSSFDISNFHIFLDIGAYEPNEYDLNLEGIPKLLKRYQFIVTCPVSVKMGGAKYWSKIFSDWANSDLWNQKNVSLGSPKKSIPSYIYKGQTTISDIPLEILAHIEQMGDKKFHDKKWAGTKGRNFRLEGFSIKQTQPMEGLKIEYMARLQYLESKEVESVNRHNDSIDTPWKEEGEFVGTRRQSRNLQGFAIRLVGPKAKDYSVIYQAHLKDTADTEEYKDGEFCNEEKGKVEAIKVKIIPIKGKES